MKKTIYRHGSINALYSNFLHLDWSITSMCNYKCSYCFGQQPIDKNKFQTKAEMLQAAKNLIATNRDSYQITLVGGEPSVHPHLQYLVNFLSENLENKISRLLLISNGSRNVSWFENFFKHNTNINFNLMFSIHTDHIKLPDLVCFIKNLATHMYINFCLMFNPDKREYVKQIYATLCKLREDYPFTMRIDQLRKPPKFDNIDDRYTKDDLAWMDASNSEFAKISNASSHKTHFRCNVPISLLWDYAENGERKLLKSVDRNQAMRTGLLNFKGMWCCMGTGVLAINPDGSCKGAQCRIATRSKYNIFQQNPFDDEDFIGLVQCTEENCGCSANDLIPKFRERDEAEEFIRIFKLRAAQPQAAQVPLVVSPVHHVTSAQSHAAMAQHFDLPYYLRTYPELKTMPQDPYAHFVHCGVYEGRNPAPWFDTKFYLFTYPDVAASGVNPFYHFLTQGKAEGRFPAPCGKGSM